MNRLLDTEFGGVERAFALFQVCCDPLFHECRGEASERQSRESREQKQAGGQREALHTLDGDRPGTAGGQGSIHRFEFRIWIVFVTSMRS